MEIGISQISMVLVYKCVTYGVNVNIDLFAYLLLVGFELSPKFKIPWHGILSIIMKEISDMKPLVA